MGFLAPRIRNNQCSNTMASKGKKEREDHYNPPDPPALSSHRVRPSEKNNCSLGKWPNCHLSPQSEAEASISGECGRRRGGISHHFLLGTGAKQRGTVNWVFIPGKGHSHHLAGRPKGLKRQVTLNSSESLNSPSSCERQFPALSQDRVHSLSHDPQPQGSSNTPA